MVNHEETSFLNVDLDIYSSKALDPLVAAFGDRVRVLFAGREGRRHSAHLELDRSGYGQSADTIIGGLVRLIRKLPRDASSLWREARVRRFDIGIQSELRPPSFELPLKAATLAAIASVQAGLVFTVYAPEIAGRPSP